MKDCKKVLKTGYKEKWEVGNEICNWRRERDRQKYEQIIEYFYIYIFSKYKGYEFCLSFWVQMEVYFFVKEVAKGFFLLN